jgi:phasin
MKGAATPTAKAASVAPKTGAVQAKPEKPKAIEDKTAEFPFADMAVPEAARAFAETTVARSREAYERAKDAVEDSVGVLEESLDKAGQGVSAMNRKVIDITQTNLNSGLDLAKSLASAKDFAQVMELQSGYARQQFETLAAQAEEIRVLAAKVANDTAEPFKSHISRSMKAFSGAQ